MSEPASKPAHEPVHEAGTSERMSEQGYRGPQVCRIIGITYRQLDYWARTDLLRPSISDARGSGTQRRYSYRDLVVLKVIKSLLDAGVSLHHARRAIAYLRDHLGEDIAAANLVLDANRSVLAHTGEQLVDLLRSGQGVLNIVPLAPVVEELDARIHEFSPPEAEAEGQPQVEGDVPAASSGG